MNISPLRTTCQKCETVFDAEIVTDAPISVAVASMEAIRCPKCGSNKCGLGGNYTDAPPVTAPLFDRVQWWKTRGERGTSSNTIFSAFHAGDLPHGYHDIPHDPDDFRRCRLLLDLIPEWRHNLQVVAFRFHYWKPFTDRWEEMDRLYSEERPSWAAPKLYALIKVAEAEADKLRLKLTRK